MISDNDISPVFEIKAAVVSGQSNVRIIGSDLTRDFDVYLFK